jgi:hypothetical protein
MDAEPSIRLDHLDEQQAFAFLAEPLSQLSAEQEYELRHDDYVTEMPQFVERLRSPQHARIPAGISGARVSAKYPPATCSGPPPTVGG